MEEPKQDVAEFIPVASTSKASDSHGYPYIPPSKVRRKNDNEEEEATGRDTPEIERNTADNCYCYHQTNDNVNFPDEAISESVAMWHGSITYKPEENINGKSTLRLTDYRIYCSNNHMCPLDTGIVEKDMILYACGYFKSVGTKCSGKEGGVPVKDVGPIKEWLTIGYNNDTEAAVLVRTECCIALLDVPSEEYAPIFKPLERKIYLTKQMVEYILATRNEDPTYEDMLEYLKGTIPPNGMDLITEEELIHSAQFLFDRVEGILEDDEDCTPILQSECVTHLMQLAGMLDDGESRSVMKKAREGNSEKPAKPMATKATTTPLVNDVFTKLFNAEMSHCNEESPTENIKAGRCGLCERCMTKECGKCLACSSMLRFGGPGIIDVDCLERECENARPTTLNLSSVAKPKKLPPTLQLKGPIFRHSESKVFYRCCKMWQETENGENIGCVTNIMSGTFVMLAPREGSKDRVIARVQAFFYMDRRSFCHVQYFERATATVLGQLANPHELVFTNTCGEVLLRTIREVLDVTYHKHENNWRNVGGTTPVFPSCNGQKQFFYNKMYDEKTCRFEDIPSVDPHVFPPLMCTVCGEKLKQLQHDALTLSAQLGTQGDKLLYSKVSYKGMVLTIGSCVYLKAAIKTTTSKNTEETLDENHDPDLYPEKCRKRHPRTEKAEDPFSVARVVAIYTTKANPGAVSDVRLQLAKFYRPEDTCLEETKLLDTRLLLWSKEYFESSLGELEGKCWVRAATELTPSPFEWCLQGPDRFFYHKAYCEQTRTITNIINNQQSDGSLNIHLDEPEEWPTLPHKLRALDVFAGCGGLSLGLHQSGVAESKWAIEVDAAAARAFKLNNPRCVMLQEDCNKLLELMLQKETHTEDGLPLPQKHQVDLLCGGPPCQGFSGMNRFSNREYSRFKNSLIVTFLSYCDILRPRYIILENVRNLVAYKNNVVLKMIFKALLTMGYQVTFGILQAGNFGVPQTRRRAFILAAAPGEVLPMFPKPTHSFNISGASTLPVTIDNISYKTNCSRSGEAPLRCVTVWDALGDLPEIVSGASKNPIKYGNQPISTFQKLMRLDCGPELFDHICKEMNPLTKARMELIPPMPNSDWRDLPNIRMRLSDGKYTEKLERHLLSPAMSLTINAMLPTELLAHSTIQNPRLPMSASERPSCRGSVYKHRAFRKLTSINILALWSQPCVYKYDSYEGKLANGGKRGVCPCTAEKGAKCNSKEDRTSQSNTLIPWCMSHTASRNNQWTGIYGRLDWHGIFATTVTNPEPMGKQGRILHPRQHRVVSVRECARSQGFPDSFKFSGEILNKHRQIGNAVPPPLACAIGSEIKKAVLKSSR